MNPSYVHKVLIFCNVVVAQGPTTSFGKRERTDGSEYSNGGATYILYARLCPHAKRCVALKLSKFQPLIS